MIHLASVLTSACDGDASVLDHPDARPSVTATAPPLLTKVLTDLRPLMIDLPPDTPYAALPSNDVATDRFEQWAIEFLDSSDLSDRPCRLPSTTDDLGTTCCIEGRVDMLPGRTGLILESRGFFVPASVVRDRDKLKIKSITKVCGAITARVIASPGPVPLVVGLISDAEN